MTKFPAILTALFTATFVLSPLVTDPFTGFRADQLPVPQINPPVQPAGYAFAIWGLIYGWLVVSALYGLIKRSENLAWDHARWPLIVSLAVGTPWLAVAIVSAIWATVLIFVMAVGAILALLMTPSHDRWWCRVPIAIYAGWLTAAFFVSLGSIGAGYSIIFNQIGWAYVGIAIVALIAVIILRRAQEPAYGLTVIWALVGIILANLTTAPGVAFVAGIGTLAIAIETYKSRPITTPPVPS